MRISDWSSDVCSSDLVLILPSELALERLHIVSHALGLLDQLLRLADLRLQRLQHSQRQALEVARLIDQRSCLVLELPDLVVDLLQRPRSGQDVLRIVARIVDDAAKLGISGRWHQRGRGQRQDRGTGGDQVAEIGGIHGITPSLLGDGLLAGEKKEARSMSEAQSSPRWRSQCGAKSCAPCDSI